MSLLIGDCRAVLPTLEAESVQCCVTSPPYWGLRDYGVADQLGLEPTPDAYVTAMVDVFREVRRVLKSDGTCWLNIGDSYVSNVGQAGRGGPPSTSSTLEGNGHRGGGPKLARLRKVSASKGYRGDRLANGRGGQIQRRKIPTAIDPKSSIERIGERPNRWWVEGLKHKDLVGIPWRVAFALQADGWWLRSDIVWAKPSPMPESVTDRPTKAHEYVFLLAKSEQYFFDAAAIKERTTGNSHPRGNGINPKARAGKNESAAAAAAAYKNETSHRRLSGFNERWRVKQNESFSAAVTGLVDFRNSRTVWTIPSAPYSGAHFATMPPQLAQRCILAGSRIGDTVLDPFMGSGTVGEVAESLGRRWLGIELNPEYAKLIGKRTAQRGLLTESA